MRRSNSISSKGTAGKVEDEMVRVYNQTDVGGQEGRRRMIRPRPGRRWGSAPKIMKRCVGINEG